MCSLHQGSYIVWQQISYSADARFNQIDGGKAIKYGFALCAVGDAGKKGSLDTFLNLKYFIHCVKLRLPARKLLWPPEGGHMAHVENRWLKALRLSMSVYWKTRLDWTENNLCCIRRMRGKPVCQPCGSIPIHQNQTQKLRAVVLKWVSHSERSESQISRSIDLVLHCIPTASCMLEPGLKCHVFCWDLLIVLDQSGQIRISYCTNVFMSNVYHRCWHAAHTDALISLLVFISGTELCWRN